VSESEELDLGALSHPNVEEISVHLLKAEGKIPPAPHLSGKVTCGVSSLARSIGSPMKSF